MSKVTGLKQKVTATPEKKAAGGLGRRTRRCQEETEQDLMVKVRRQEEPQDIAVAILYRDS